MLKTVGKMKRLAILFALIFCTMNCFAKQICFQVVQHDISAKDVTEQSLIIEDEILNRFFEYGYIVTNAAAQVSASDSIDETLFKSGVGEAFNGFSDYFVQINLFFDRNETTTTAKADLKKIDFAIANPV